MGQAWSSWTASIWSLFSPNREYKLVLVGLDNAGKTSVLYRLHLGQPVVTTATIGSNVEQVQHENLTFEVRQSAVLQTKPCLGALVSSTSSSCCWHSLGSRASAPVLSVQSQCRDSHNSAQPQLLLP